ncbi:Nuclear pore complex protein nup35 [Thalictrum thalictroides]|uniref:Nuclear pore complex protein NUP35 n=1 Tax=Thalictrum thalictroides TaxID=46969 RepID=A0A7J6W248_THATH|nr:Nuclear pore complex protein nup35 [Thalictrum thalictroides]
MSTSAQRSSRSSGKSLFFQDLATPVSSHRGKFASTGQAAAVSALWRENFGGTDPPPPPVFTLEDRADFSPESGVLDYPRSSESKSEFKTPVRESPRDSLTPLKSRFDASGSYSVKSGHQWQQSPASSSWWSPGRSGNENEEKGKSSPVDGVVQPGALITLPPPREVARPEMQRNTLPAGDLDEEEWVTVYGFSPVDTNLVLREFEKCGTILKHVPGPGSANWMHILYQSRFDAHKALNKSGMQINGVLIVGVKLLDPMQRQALNERPNNQGFMTLPPPSNRNKELIPSKASRPYYLQNNGQNTQGPASVIASPVKSVVAKIKDLMFGI